MNISRFSLGAYTADQLANMPVSTVNGCPVVDLCEQRLQTGSEHRGVQCHPGMRRSLRAPRTFNTRFRLLRPPGIRIRI